MKYLNFKFCIEIQGRYILICQDCWGSLQFLNECNKPNNAETASTAQRRQAMLLWLVGLYGYYCIKCPLGAKIVKLTFLKVLQKNT